MTLVRLALVCLIFGAASAGAESFDQQVESVVRPLANGLAAVVFYRVDLFGQRGFFQLRNLALHPESLLGVLEHQRQVVHLPFQVEQTKYRRQRRIDIDCLIGNTLAFRLGHGLQGAQVMQPICKF